MVQLANQAVEDTNRLALPAVNTDNTNTKKEKNIRDRHNDKIDYSTCSHRHKANFPLHAACG